MLLGSPAVGALELCTTEESRSQDVEEDSHQPSLPWPLIQCICIDAGVDGEAAISAGSSDPVVDLQGF